MGCSAVRFGLSAQLLLLLLLRCCCCGVWASAGGLFSGDGGPSASVPEEVMSELLKKIGGDGGGMQQMLQKLAVDLAGSGAEGAPTGGPIEADDSFSDFVKDLPDLGEWMKRMGDEKSGFGFDGRAPGSDGGAPRVSAELKSLVESLLTDSEEGRGLMHHFKELQRLTSGRMDLKKLSKTFKGLSGAIKARGSDMSVLMKEMLDSPAVYVAPVGVPAPLQRLYSRRLSSQPIADGLGSDLTRPPPVSLAAIRGFIASVDDQLPPEAPEAQCHALVLSGGVARAPLQAGALLGLAEQYKARGRELKWDVVAAVNKAALSAAASLAFLPGENGEIDFGRYLWDMWGRMKSENLLGCPGGLRDMLNLPRILQWLVEAQEAVSSGLPPSRLSVPHDCDVSAAADTLQELLQQLPLPRAAAAHSRRQAVVTAARVGGGKQTWVFSSVGSPETCLMGGAPEGPLQQLFSSSQHPTCGRQEAPEDQQLPPLAPETETDLTLKALLATNATPGVSPLVPSWSPEGPLLGAPPPSSFSRQGGGPFPPKAAFADGRLVANFSVGEAVRVCQHRIAGARQETPAAAAAAGVSRDSDLKRGKGIVLDIVGTAPIDETDVEEQLLSVAESLGLTRGAPRGAPTPANALPVRELLKRLQKQYPLLTVRHVLLPEEQLPLMSDYADYRSSEALLHQGRLIGWKALTLEDLI